MSIVHETALIKCSKHFPIPAKKIGHQIFYFTTMQVNWYVSMIEPMDISAQFFLTFFVDVVVDEYFLHILLVFVSLAKVCTYIKVRFIIFISQKQSNGEQKSVHFIFLLS